MRDEKQFWTVSWSQPYTAYVVSNPNARSQPQPEPELEDLTQARQVLARIMSK